jgi:hypothetical protein
MEHSIEDRGCETAPERMASARHKFERTRPLLFIGALASASFERESDVVAHL